MGDLQLVSVGGGLQPKWINWATSRLTVQSWVELYPSVSFGVSGLRRMQLCVGLCCNILGYSMEQYRAGAGGRPANSWLWLRGWVCSLFPLWPPITSLPPLVSINNEPAVYMFLNYPQLMQTRAWSLFASHDWGLPAMAVADANLHHIWCQQEWLGGRRRE